jgi:hypothetical protein
MTDDLVKRLRRADTCIFPTERDRCHCGEAADRILKLEAALREMIDWDNVLDLEDYPPWDDAMELARKALEGKDD